MNPKITALYCRVSTDIQRERESVSHQRKRLSEYCLKEEFERTQEFIDDGFSGGDLDRPQMNRLLTEIKNNRVACLIVTSMDRLTRSTKDQENVLELLELYNVRLVALDQNVDTFKSQDDYFADISLNTASFTAQNERTLTRSRVKRAMFQRARDGKWNGGVIPFGYTSFCLEIKRFIDKGYDEDHARIEARKICAEEKKLYVYPSEAKAVKQIFKDFIETNSLRIVRDRLHEKGIMTRNGDYWARNSISRILKSPVYIGKLWYGKRKTSKRGKGLLIVPKEQWVLTEGKHEPIISLELFDKVQLLLAQKKVNRLRFDTTYLLAGILKCGKCEGNMQGKSTLKKNGRIHAYYRCYTKDQKGNCDCRPVQKELIEKTVSDTILSLYQGQQLMDMQTAIKRHNELMEKTKGPVQKEYETLTKRTEQLSKKKTTLFELVEDGTISRSDFKKRMEEITREYETNNVKLEDLRLKLMYSNSSGVDLEKIYRLVNDLPALWRKAVPRQRRLIVQRILKNVLYHGVDKPLTINLNLRVGDFERMDIHSEHLANRPLSHFAYTLQVNLPKPYESIKQRTFGDRIRYARMKSGYRQQDLGTMLGVTKDCVRRWELMKNSPSESSLKKLTAILKLKGESHVNV